MMILLCTDMHNNTSYGCANTKYGAAILLGTDMRSITLYGCVNTIYGCDDITVYGYA